MGKITRKTAVLFGVNAGSTGVETFASKAQTGSLDPSTDPADLQAQPYWGLGWTAAQYEGIRAPWFQDRNAVDLVIFWQLAYALEMGVSEWDSFTVYYENSVVQQNGQLFQSLQDNNQGNTPPVGTSNAWWQYLQFPGSLPPTRTVYASGSGTYAPPTGCVRIFVRLVGGGGGGGAGAGSGAAGTQGGNTTFGTSLTAAGGNGGPGVGDANGSGGAATGGDVNIRGGGSLNATRGGTSKFGGDMNAPGSGSGGNSPGGGGGGTAGGYLEKTIVSPAASYIYSVGGGGAGGIEAGYTSGQAGASGIIIIDEFYY